jgi:hypothetical protein
MLIYKDMMNKALMRRNLLSMYIGKEYNEEIKVEIEGAFDPYKLIICDIDYYYLEICLTNTIRCVVENGNITHLCFY